MKTKAFVLIMILSISCKKQPDISVPPFLDIIFDIPISNVEPIGPDTVYAKYFVSVLSVQILENHLEQFKIKDPDSEQRIFAFQITTPEDSEVFVKGQNVGVTGGMVFGKDNNVARIDFTFNVPVKFSGRVTINNDTVEYSKESDYIKVQYKSGYSGRIVRKTLIIK